MDSMPFDCTLHDPFVELDLRDAGLDPDALEALAPKFEAAFDAMQALEAGDVANASEQRMVGHYWLRAPGRAPDAALSDAIGDTLDAVLKFAAEVHAGAVAPPEGGRFDKLVLCGIGGSALGPMLVADCLDAVDQPMQFFAFDNTDPDGIARTLAQVGDLTTALVLVISKSGGTPETRNAMIEVERACSAAGIAFAPRAVAVTGEGSALAQRAADEGWRATFPMWDWVGGRTSVTSAVGVLPAALLGYDVRALLTGAAAMDDLTRLPDVARNPAAALAAYWHVQSEGVGARDLVVLPYADRLLLLSRYLQQLVMESLGKRVDRQGEVVHQGLAVYGNKGSTDQHAYVQQLRDGLHNFFALFVRVLDNGGGAEVDPGVHTGDYLNGFYLGTRAALAESGRRSATLHVRRCDERTLGALIALFERAVGLYAELIDVNAYDQPGVEAGKKAANQVLALQAALLTKLDATPRSAAEVAAELPDADPDWVWELCRHLAATRDGVRQTGAADRASARFARG